MPEDGCGSPVVSRTLPEENEDEPNRISPTCYTDLQTELEDGDYFELPNGVRCPFDELAGGRSFRYGQGEDFDQNSASLALNSR